MISSYYVVRISFKVPCRVESPNLSLGRGYKLSHWWKYLVGLGVLKGVVGDWVQEVFTKKVGDGGTTLGLLGGVGPSFFYFRAPL
jgi:hypothetical protein